MPEDNSFADHIHDTVGEDIMGEDKKLFNEAAAERCVRVPEDDEPDRCYFCGMQQLDENDGKIVTIEESNSETGPMPSDMTDVWVCGRCEGSKDL